MKKSNAKKVLKKVTKSIQKKTDDIKLKIEFMKIDNPITSLGSKIANIFEPPAHYGMNDSDDYEWRLRHMSKNNEELKNNKNTSEN